MKKLVVLALVAAATVFAVQANCVQWQYTTRYTTTKGPDDPIDIGGYTAYLVSASDWTDSKFETLDAKKIDTATITKSVSGTTTTYTTGVIESNTSLPTSSTKQDFYVVLVNDADKTHYYTASTQATVYEAGATSGVTPGTVTMNGTNGLSTSMFNANTFADASSSGGGVPEPTSGLLLLIGGAMLALRRKQK